MDRAWSNEFHRNKHLKFYTAKHERFSMLMIKHFLLFQSIIAQQIPMKSTLLKIKALTSRASYLFTGKIPPCTKSKTKAFNWYESVCLTEFCHRTTNLHEHLDGDCIYFLLSRDKYLQEAILDNTEIKGTQKYWE